MISLIQQHRPDVAALCRHYGVQSLDVFGSAAGDTFDPAHSDIDFLVVFSPAETTGLFQRFFGLQEALENLLQRKVDLVSAAALSNPYFIAEVNRTRQTVYASANAQAA
jgi:predicted nucleotidyltransferase